MQGRPLGRTAGTDGGGAGAGRTSALFGMFGGHVNITDGRYVYMRACHDDTNLPLNEHTLIPTASADTCSWPHNASGRTSRANPPPAPTSSPRAP
ncbi:hypothetical protein ACH4L5_35825 [Streptomyces sp. NPDC017405]|uniref:hypothetical protein n=1 Tax=unclassified Streptomyces TaxID=2593676 RepID=UPI0037A4C3F0